MTENGPSYIVPFRSGELERKAGEALDRMGSCDICPRKCGVDRFNGELGHCGIGRSSRIASFGPHFGEEGPLMGRCGSGTIFFSGCNLSCQFCQNWDISQKPSGGQVDASELADMMMKLQGMGCHNINLVSPSHVVPQFLEALEKACMKGLELPIVFNSGGYDSVRTLELLDGIVDIYMPDMKYSDPVHGERLSLVPDYPVVNQRAVKEMHRQVGDLVIDDRGIAVKGLLVRHLVLPNHLAGTEEMARFLAENISKDTYLNIMAQYHPEFNVRDHADIRRRPTSEEYNKALTDARKAGLHRFDRDL